MGTQGHRGVGLRCAGSTALKTLGDGRVCGPRVKGLRELSVRGAPRGGAGGHDFAHLVDENCISQSFAITPRPHPGAGTWTGFLSFGCFWERLCWSAGPFFSTGSTVRYLYPISLSQSAPVTRPVPMHTHAITHACTYGYTHTHDQRHLLQK